MSIDGERGGGGGMDGGFVVRGWEGGRVRGMGTGGGGGRWMGRCDGGLEKKRGEDGF